MQHHPEAGPGPHDSRYLFARFADRMIAYRGGRIPNCSRMRPELAACQQLRTGIEPVGLPEPAAGVA